MKKIAIFTGLNDINGNIVGTAIAYKKIAELLSKNNNSICMVIPNQDCPNDKNIAYYYYNQENNRKIINQSDIIIFGAYPPIADMEYANKKKKKIISYLWTLPPMHSFEFTDNKTIKEHTNLHKYIINSYNKNLLLSDKIFCRSIKHKNFILGSIISLHRATLTDYKKNPQLNNLIDIAPFGIEKHKPINKKKVYRGVIKNIAEEDFILLWNGGIWNWDNGTLMVETMKRLKSTQNIKLVFQGFKHPNKHQKITSEAEKTYSLAKKYGLIGKNIFINENWIPYADRADYLMEANIAITLRKNILESEYLIKTRYLDNIWAGLPIITNIFDASKEEIENNGLGILLKKENPSYIAKEIINLCENRKKYLLYKTNISLYKKSAPNWDTALNPILKYCND